LDSRCSNNQAEHLAIVKALEVIETIDIMENSPRTGTILTDSRISIDSLKNVNNHSYLIENIRKRISILQTANWTIRFYFPHICAFVAFLCLPLITINHAADILTKDTNTSASFEVIT
jgi:membrane-associated protease RseP (regulator of RpoE activity)